MAIKESCIARLNRDYIYLTTPYDAEFVEIIRSLPRGTHWWDDWHKEWKISYDYWPSVKEKVETFFGRNALTEFIPHVWISEIREDWETLDNKNRKLEKENARLAKEIERLTKLNGNGTSHQE